MVTFIVWETDCEWQDFDLLLKQVLLIEKEHNGCVHEPFVVENTAKQFQTLSHSVLSNQK